MSRIARSEAPIYQTRARPVRFTVTVTEPGGAKTDLTGAQAAAVARWQGVERPLVATTEDPATDGRITITGDASMTRDWPEGRVAEVLLTITDSLGGMLDFLWPVVGEI